METEKLYYNDGKLSAFTAAVLECREAKDGWDVVLDRTAFYPEGGGQPCDRGTLERLEVLDDAGAEGLHSAPVGAAVAAGHGGAGGRWIWPADLIMPSSIPPTIFSLV